MAPGPGCPLRSPPLLPLPARCLSRLGCWLLRIGDPVFYHTCNHSLLRVPHRRSSSGPCICCSPSPTDLLLPPVTPALLLLCSMTMAVTMAVAMAVVVVVPMSSPGRALAVRVCGFAAPMDNRAHCLTPPLSPPMLGGASRRPARVSPPSARRVLLGPSCAASQLLVFDVFDVLTAIGLRGGKNRVAPPSMPTS